MLTTLIVTLAMHAPAPGIVETTFYGLVEVQPAANGGTIGGYLNRPRSAERTGPTNRTHPRRPSPPDRADQSAASRRVDRRDWS